MRSIQYDVSRDREEPRQPGGAASDFGGYVAFPASSRLWTRLWENTAMPELRVEAAALSERITTRFAASATTRARPARDDAARVRDASD